MPKLSIIIPTLNEELYLSGLLASLQEQDWRDFEIIVSDSGSSDSTREIAQRFGVRVVEGPRRGPAHGRNLGAQQAQGELLLFLDADVVFPRPDILGRAVEEFERRKLEAAGFPFRSLENLWRYRLLLVVGSALGWLSQWISPWVPGWAILVRRDAHQRVGGFDETPAFREDHVYVGQVRKLGKVRYLRAGPIKVSARRFEHQGTGKTLAIYLLTELARPFGRVPYAFVRYQFGSFSRERKGKNGLASSSRRKR